MKEQYPTRLVWLLSLLGLYTTLVMVTIVLWGTGDVSKKRERLTDLQSKFTAFYSKLENTIDLYNWDLISLLDDPKSSANKLAGKSHLHNLQDNFNKIFQLMPTEKPLEELEDEIKKLEKVTDDCLTWRQKREETLKSLPVIESEVFSILEKFDETIIDIQVQLRHDLISFSRRGQNNSAGDTNYHAALAGKISLGRELSSINRNIFNLYLLITKMKELPLTENLASIKDKEFYTTLIQFQSHIEKILKSNFPQAKFLQNLFTRLSLSLFGEGYEIHAHKQSITPGVGNLYNTILESLNQQEDQKKLKALVSDHRNYIHKLMNELTRFIESYLAKETEQIDAALKNVWQIILIVGSATGSIFLFISYRIILEIKSQIKAIEDTNIMLDSQTKALMKSEKALQESEKRLEYLSSNLLAAQENERRRIALELHDELGQSMAAMKIHIGSIERNLGIKSPETLKAECSMTRQFINDIIENVRRLSRDLSPVVLDDLGLETAMEYLASTFSRDKNIRIDLEVGNIDHLFQQDSKRLIYRIIQESLTNIAKHAHADTAHIQAVKKGDLVNFRITDNGIGFNLEEVMARKIETKGMGLTAMAERVRILGGSIDIRSRPGKGSTITFTAPVFSAG